MESSGNTLAQKAYDILLNRIITIQYEPGTVLNEQGLVSDLNISRTPIHAACIQLQHDGLIEFIAKKGIRVTDIDADFIRDIHDMRAMIEPYALEKYGCSIPKEQLLRYLRQFADPATTKEALFDLDLDLHTQLVHQTGNRLLCSYFDTLRHHIARIANICGRRSTNRLAASNKEHESLLIPLINDDIPGAVEALRKHLKNSREVACQLIVIDPQLSSIEVGGGNAEKQDT